MSEAVPRALRQVIAAAAGGVEGQGGQCRRDAVKVMVVFVPAVSSNTAVSLKPGNVPGAACTPEPFASVQLVLAPAAPGSAVAAGPAPAAGEDAPVDRRTAAASPNAPG